jgi:hypothetical protein
VQINRTEHAVTTENGVAIFDKVADIIAVTSDIPRDKIKPQEVNDGKATTEQYFVLSNLCASIDGLSSSIGSSRIVDLPHPALGQELTCITDSLDRRAGAGPGRWPFETIKRERTEYIAATIPRAGLLILPNTSHFALLQDPELFNSAVLHFPGKR